MAIGLYWGPLQAGLGPLGTSCGRLWVKGKRGLLEPSWAPLGALLEAPEQVAKNLDL